jgi:hypothetical protein
MTQVTGAVIALVLLAVLATVLVLGKVAERVADRRNIGPAEPEEDPEEPEPRAHEPGGCWCDQFHEPAASDDDEPAWKMS